MTISAELEREIADIRREVIESRNLVIKTDNLLKNLHAELKAVSKRQEDFQRRTLLSSGVAYALFTILVVGGAAIASGARTASAREDRDRLAKSNEELTTTAEKQRLEATTNAAAVKSASDVYRMMTELPGEERLKGISALAKLDTARLNPLEKRALTDRAEILRKELGQTAFERGKGAFRRNDMPGTVEELGRFLAMNPSESDQLEASFYLGTAYAQQRKYEQAVPLLARFVEKDRRSKSRDWAMVLLAQSYEQTGNPAKAAEVARDGIGTYPESQFVPQLKGRLASAKRAMASGSESAGAGAGLSAAPGGTADAGLPGVGGSRAIPRAPRPGAPTSDVPPR